MEKDLVTIEVLKHEKLIEAFTKLEIIRKTVEKDDTQYGYSSETKMIIDAVLNITRK